MKRARAPDGDGAAAAEPRFRALGASVGELLSSLAAPLVAEPALHAPAAAVTAAAAAPASSREEALAFGLDPRLAAALAAAAPRGLFPVQRLVVPVLLAASRGLDAALGDVCVSAPTGSGKTLCYALPILDALLREERQARSSGAATAPRRLRAVALLPTRDLAQQVFRVFVQLLAGVAAAEAPGASACPPPVRVALSVGQTAFAHEQASVSSACAVAARAAFGAAARADGALGESERGCDVLVCTPGRLMDHLDSTPGFDLSHLRFLAIDEADRLLAESYQDWVRRVNEAVFTAPWTGARQTYVRGGVREDGDDSRGDGLGALPSHVGSIAPFFGRTSRHAGADRTRVGNVLTPDVWAAAETASAVAGAAAGPRGSRFAPPAWAEISSTLSSESSSAPLASLLAAPPPTPMVVPFTRIVCSATLTTNPQKLAALGLHQPRYFVSTHDIPGRATVEGSIANPGEGEGDDEGEDVEGDAADGAGERRIYTLPATLHQAYAVVGAAEKPTALVFLLRMLEGQHLAPQAFPAAFDGLRALVFAGSLETTHRLCRLLQLYGGLRGRVVEFSASLSQTKRSAVVEAARAGVVSVIVSSDAAARGLDLPSLPAVIHYDVAPRLKTYVHRVGRCARAGRAGLTFSLVKPDQARHFKQLLARTAGGAAGGGVLAAAKESMQPALCSAYAPRMQLVLARLQLLLEEERAGASESRPVAALPE